MTNRLRCIAALNFLLWLVIGGFAVHASAIELHGTAPNFRILDEADEIEKDFYRVVEDHVTLLWFWDWEMGCPI